VSATSDFPSASVSTTPHSTHNLRPSAIVGISIGAVASVAILAGLAASTVVFRRRRRRAKSRNHEVDFRVFDSASEFHEDKRRWSQLSSSFGTASGSESRPRDIEDASEAEYITVMLGVAELEGN
jgi:predicted acylesterase/phospholipase RssA